jgi:hypothetical protein
MTGINQGVLILTVYSAVYTSLRPGPVHDV